MDLVNDVADEYCSGLVCVLTLWTCLRLCAALSATVLMAA